MSSNSFGSINSTEFHFRWRLKFDEDKISDKDTGQYVSSPEYTTQTFGKEVKWRIDLYPNGFSQEFEDDVGVFLTNLSSFEVEATTRFYLVDYKNNNKKYKYQMKKHLYSASTRTTWGNVEFVKYNSFVDEKKKLLLNGEITIGCKIIIHSILNHDRPVFNRLSEFDNFKQTLFDTKYSDCEIICEGKKLHTNKSILASRSSTFKAMFENNTSEESQSVVEIKDTKYHVFLEVLRFIYSGKVNKIETMVSDLLNAASQYSLEGLKLMCEDALLSRLDKNNAIDYLIKTSQNNCKSVSIISDFIVNNSEDLVKTLKFRSLMTTHPNLTYQIMNDLVYKKKN